MTPPRIEPCLPWTQTVNTRPFPSADVAPKIHTDTVHVCGGKEVVGRGEGYASSHAARPEGVDQTSGWNIECPNDGVQGGGDEPARVRREGLYMSAGYRK
jgi:hypothetical protein